MSAGSFAQRMITRLENMLETTPPGATSVRNPDGSSVAWNREQAIKELSYWRIRAAEEASGRPAGAFFEVPLAPRDETQG